MIWTMSDRLGTIRQLAKLVHDGEIDQYSYQPFHTFHYDTFGQSLNPISVEGVTPHFTGRDLDTDSGLYYYRARWYDPSAHRFISEDPFGFAGGDTNKYRYVFNNPENLKDPTGKTAVNVAGAVVGGIHGGIEAYYASDGNLLWTLAGIGLGAGFGLVNPYGAFLSAGGALIGAGTEYYLTGGESAFTGFQIGGLVGGLSHAFLDGAYGAMKGSQWGMPTFRAALLAGSKEIAPELIGAFSLGSYGYFSSGGDWKSTYDYATMGMFGGGIAQGGYRASRYMVSKGGGFDRMAAYAQIFGDYLDAPAYARWARQVDGALIDGYTPQKIKAVLESVGPAPTRSSIARLASSWLKHRGFEVLYRGSKKLEKGEDFLSDIASGRLDFRGETGLAASRELANLLLRHNVDPRKMRAMYGTEMQLPWGNVDPELVGIYPGGAGIPFSERIPVSAGYAQHPGTILYATLQEIGSIPLTNSRAGVWELEHVALHQVSHLSILIGLPGRWFPTVRPPLG